MWQRQKTNWKHAVWRMRRWIFGNFKHTCNHYTPYYTVYIYYTLLHLFILTQEWNNECLDCRQGGNGGIIFAFIIVSWCYVLFIHATSQAKKNSGIVGVFLYFSNYTDLH